MSRARTIALGCAFLTIASCPGSDDRESLKVVGHSITGADVSLDAVLVLEFNDELDESTLPGRVVLEFEDTQDPSQHTEHPCAVTTTGRELRIAPESILRPAHRYRLTLREGIAGRTRDGLPSDWTFEFSVEFVYPVELPPFDVVRHGYDMHDVWGNEDGFIAVGANGLALISSPSGRFVLPARGPASTVVSHSLDSVWCTGEGVVYIAAKIPTGGIPLIFEFAHGRALRGAYARGSEEPVGDIHGWNADEVFAAHGDGVSRMGDEAWEHLPRDGSLNDPHLFDLWVDSSEIMYVAGTDGVYRSPFPYIEWETVYRSDIPCVAIDGVAADRVVVASGGRLIWLEGGPPVFAKITGHSMLDVSWVDPDLVTAVGERDADGAGVMYETSFAGLRLQVISPTEKLTAVSTWFPAQWDKRGVAVGTGGVETRLEEEGWTKDPLPKRDAAGEIPDWKDLMGCPQAVLYGVRNGELVRGDLATGTWTTIGAPTDLIARAVYCVADDDVWILCDDGFDRFTANFDGTQWTTRWLTSLDVPNDLWVSDTGVAYIACDLGTVYHAGGAPMSAVNPPQDLYGIWGTDSSSVYAVGDNGTIVHYDGKIWSVQAPGLATVPLRAVWGSGKSNVVAVGDGATLLRFDGTAWVDMKPGDDVDLDGVDLNAVWTSGPFNIWASSADGVVIHYNGTKWQRWHTAFLVQHLNALTAAAGDIWIGGDRDMLLRKATPPDPVPLITEK